MEIMIVLGAVLCVVGISAIVVLVAATIMLRNKKQRDEGRDALRKRGVMAPAIIHASRRKSGSRGSAGYWLNMTFEVEVQPENQPAFKATFHDSLPVSQHEYFNSGDGSKNVGRKIWVTYDPNDTAQMIFEHYDSDHEYILKRSAFERLEKRNKEIRQTGVEALAIILEAEDLKITNPVEKDHLQQTIMRLKLEVTSKDSSNYQAETQGLIANTSLHKYSVGRKVYVKFNPLDRTQVALIRSAEE